MAFFVYLLAMSLPAVARPLTQVKAADLPASQVRKLSDVDKARLQVYAITECIVDVRGFRVLEFLEMTYDDPRSLDRQVSLVTRSCANAHHGVKIPKDLGRGAFFRAIYQREKKAGVPVLGAKADYSGYVADRSQPESALYLAMMDFASCVVRAVPASAESFVLALPGTDAEASALAALKPQLGPCLIAGGEIAINKANLSAVLAEALYRETQGTRSNVAEVSQ